MKHRLLTLLAALLLMTSLLPSSVATALSSEGWAWRNPTERGTALEGVTYANGRFVAVGESGVILTSSDGLAWESRNSGTTKRLTGVAYGAGRYVAVGDAVVASTDLVNWQAVTTPAKGTINAVIHSGTQFMAVDSQGQVLTSADGLTWKAISLVRTFSPFDRAVSAYTVAYGSGQYFVLTSDGKTHTSRDGVTWSSHDTIENRNRVVAAGGRLFELGDGALMLSSNGSYWERRELPTSDPIDDLAHQNGTFVAISREGQIYKSATGDTWTEVHNDFLSEYKAIAAGGGRFVIVGSYGRIWTSADGTAWTFQYGGVAEHLNAVAAGNSAWVAVGRNGAVFRAPDGWTWSLQQSGVRESLRAVAFGAGLFVAMGDGGTIITSPDGTTWTRRNSGTSRDLIAVTYGGGQFVAISNLAGTVLTSPDGLSWTVVSGAGTPGGLRGVAFGDGRYVAVGVTGAISVSTDGRTWLPMAGPTQLDLNAIIYGSGQFVAVGGQAGSDGVVLTWTPGNPWFDTYHTRTQALHSITFEDGRFVAAGDKGTLAFSRGGRAWSKLQQYEAYSFRGIALAGRQLIMVGDLGRIMGVRLADPAKSTVVAAQSIVTVAKVQKTTITLTLVDSEGRPLSFRTVALTPEGSSDRLTAQTDSDGVARFEVTGTGSVTYIASVPGEQLDLNQRVTVEFRVCGNRFPDLPGSHPACMAVERLAEQNIISGRPEGFAPEAGLTRAELAAMLVRALGQQPNPAGTLTFTDVAGHWAVRDGWIQAAVQSGAFAGLPDNTFRPNDPVTRSVLIKAVAAAGGLKEVSGSGYAAWFDVPENAWYKGWLNAAKSAEIIGSNAPHPVFIPTSLKPEQPATRAEAAMILANMIERKK